MDIQTIARLLEDSKELIHDVMDELRKARKI